MVKISIGTAQFGSPYGVANKTGVPSLLEIQMILEYAKDVGVKHIDTAMGYGLSETFLGKNNIEGFEVVSKLKKVPSDCEDVFSWVDNQVKTSLKRLNVSFLGGLLVHYPEDMLGLNADKLAIALKQVKSLGLVKKNRDIDLRS